MYNRKAYIYVMTESILTFNVNIKDIKRGEKKWKK